MPELEFAVYKNNGEFIGVLSRAAAMKYFTEPQHRHVFMGRDWGNADYHARPTFDGGETEAYKLWIERAEDFETLERFLGNKPGPGVPALEIRPGHRGFMAIYTRVDNRLELV
jgi:hypothetical protein